MTIKELDDQLPNGFHDAEFKSLAVDYVQRQVRIAATLCVAVEGDLDDPARKELRRDGELIMTGLQFLSIEPPDARYEFAMSKGLQVDLCEEPSAKQIAAVAKIPRECFVAGFFVNDWNSRIYLAARDAAFAWTGEPYIPR